VSASPQFKRANLGQLVRPEDFRRSLHKMISIKDEEFDRLAQFTEAYEDSFTEAGIKEGSLEHASVIMVLTAFSHALFERIY
jgi:hypothetical protein